MARRDIIFYAPNALNERRLLLNDPDITGRRLAHLESTQQELTKLLARCNATIAALQAKDVAVDLMHFSYCRTVNRRSCYV
jgi:hypothetical protein